MVTTWVDVTSLQANIGIEQVLARDGVPLRRSGAHLVTESQWLLRASRPARLGLSVAVKKSIHTLAQY
jgi:hypothetical protein